MERSSKNGSSNMFVSQRVPKKGNRRGRATFIRPGKRKFEAAQHLENLKSSEREKQVLEDRLRTEERKVESVRHELNECTSKLLLLETSSRELKDELEDKRKVIKV